MPDTSKMTPEEYAAFTGGMSFPVGKADAQAEVDASRACRASAVDYVAGFVRALEDPAMRLVTEKSHDWICWGNDGKAAILAVLRDGVNYRKTIDFLSEPRARRAQLVRKNNREGLTPEEQFEFDCLRAHLREQIEAYFPRPTDEAREAAEVAPQDLCTEPGCVAVAAGKIGPHPYCQKHIDEFPF